MSFFQDPANWVFLSFCLFAIAFVRVGWKQVLAMLDGRIEDIRHDIDAAAQLHREATAMLADYQNRQRNALKEAEEITARARAQAETIRAKAEADLRDTIARRERQLEDRLARMEQAAMAELRAATAALAVKAAEDVIRKELDAKGQAALVDQSVGAIATSNIN